MKTFDVQSSKVQFLYEKENQEGKQKENHPQGTEFVSQDPEFGQKDFEEKTGL